jgi:hypothetical protein
MAMSGVYGDQMEALRGRVEEDYRQAEQNYHQAEENYRQAEQNYHQAEENYRLDMSAIEHLQRRFFGAVSSIPTSNDSPPSNGSYSEPPSNRSYSEPPSNRSYSEPPSNGSYSEPPTTILPPQPTPATPLDDLVGSIRETYRNQR